MQPDEEIVGNIIGLPIIKFPWDRRYSFGRFEFPETLTYFIERYRDREISDRTTFPDAYPTDEFEAKMCVEIYNMLQPLVNAVFHQHGQSLSIVVKALLVDLLYMNIYRVRETLKNLANIANKDFFIAPYMEDDYLRSPLLFVNREIKIPGVKQSVEFEALIRLLMQPGNILGNIAQYIETQYANAGFTARYFMYYNADSPATRFSQEDKAPPLRPDTFELSSSREEVVEFINNMEAHSQRNTPIYFRNRVPRFTSWSKEKLRKAILSSGLEELMYPDSSSNKTVIYGRNLGWGSSFPVITSDPNDDGIVSAIIYGSTGSLAVFRHAYRFIFKTMDFFNWKEACMANAISFETLKLFAEMQYGITNPPSTSAQLCDLVQSEAKRRTIIVDQLKTLLPDRAEEVKYGNPNSRLVREGLMGSTMAPKVKLMLPYEQFVLVEALCKDNNVDSQMFQLKLAEAGMQYMIPAGYESLPKSKLCDYVKEGIMKDSERFQFLDFDCSDPAIKKRHILNAVTIMELTIFKDVDVESATKEQLCAIITNYIYTDMEKRALKIAQIH